MKSNPKRPSRGFTLVELTIAIMMGLATGTMVLSLFNQQLAFLGIFKVQGFLTEEAPIISTYVSRLVGKADRFRLHASLNDALSGTNPRLTDSPVVVMNFRQPDGKIRAAILEFRNLPADRALYYYIVPLTGPLGTPEWAVTRSPKDVIFRIEEGVLRMVITGPQDERITYSGTMQQ